MNNSLTEREMNAATPYIPEYEEFIKEHPGRGSLKIQISAADSSFPVDNVTVEVALMLDGIRYVLYKAVTDSSGIVNQIVLPANPASDSQNPETAGDCEVTYLISAFRPGFEEITDFPVVIHDGIETILPIDFCPVGSCAED